jgi:hypothetical protein
VRVTVLSLSSGMGLSAALLSRVVPAEAALVQVVIAGLDPAIHHFRKTSLRRRWMRGLQRVHARLRRASARA